MWRQPADGASSRGGELKEARYPVSSSSCTGGPVAAEEVPTTSGSGLQPPTRRQSPDRNVRAPWSSSIVSGTSRQPQTPSKRSGCRSVQRARLGTQHGTMRVSTAWIAKKFSSTGIKLYYYNVPDGGLGGGVYGEKGFVPCSRATY